MSTIMCTRSSIPGESRSCTNRLPSDMWGESSAYGWSSFSMTIFFTSSSLRSRAPSMYSSWRSSSPAMVAAEIMPRSATTQTRPMPKCCKRGRFAPPCTARGERQDANRLGEIGSHIWLTIVDGSERRGRIDIRVGVGGRRRWCAEDKGRIVAESYAPGAVASEVARRHEITPQHLLAWRKAARAGRLTLPAEEAPMFVPVVTTTREVGAAGALANRNRFSAPTLMLARGMSQASR